MCKEFYELRRNEESAELNVSEPIASIYVRITFDLSFVDMTSTKHMLNRIATFDPFASQAQLLSTNEFRNAQIEHTKQKQQQQKVMENELKIRKTPNFDSTNQEVLFWSSRCFSLFVCLFVCIQITKMEHRRVHLLYMQNDEQSFADIGCQSRVLAIPKCVKTMNFYFAPYIVPWNRACAHNCVHSFNILYTHSFNTMIRLILHCCYFYSVIILFTLSGILFDFDFSYLFLLFLLYWLHLKHCIKSSSEPIIYVFFSLFWQVFKWFYFLCRNRSTNDLLSLSLSVSLLFLFILFI